MLLAACLVGQANAQWAYTFERDPMTDGQNIEARVRSANVHTFAFPYRGGTRATLVIRSHPKFGVNVFMWIDRGQFGCHRDCSVQVRFDDAEPIDAAITGSGDGSSDIVFFSDEEAFIEKAKLARRVRISATYFQHGDLMYEFRTPGLTWPPEPPKGGKAKRP